MIVEELQIEHDLAAELLEKHKSVRAVLQANNAKK
jgi:N-acetylmuramic acid 6-phosphate etherase